MKLGLDARFVGHPGPWCEVRGFVEGSQAVTVPLEAAKMGAFFGARGAGCFPVMIIKIDCESVPKIRD